MLKGIFTTVALVSTVAIASAQTPTAPMKPTGANLVQGTAFTLTWTDTSNNELCFPVELKRPNSTVWEHLACVPRNVNVFTDYQFIPGNYCYRVKAINDLGDSDYSNTACKDFVPTIPVAPVALGMQVNEVNRVMWTPVPGALGIHIYRKIGATGAWGLYDQGINSFGIYHDHKIAVGATYCYRLKAWNYGGDSVDSGEVCP